MEGWLAIAPFITLFVGMFVTYFANKIGERRERPYLTGIIASVFFAITLLLLYELMAIGKFPIEYSLIAGGVELRVNEFGIFLGVIATLLGLIVSVFSTRYMDRDTRLDIYYPLLLAVVAGVIGVGFSGDMFNLYVFFEMMAIPSYALVAFRVHRWEPVEAGFKYIVMTAAGSIIALFGISIIFTQAGGELSFPALRNVFAAMGPPEIYPLYAAVIFLIVGFGVKAALVPLHMWAPDAYPAAPSGVGAILAGIVTQAGLIAMIKCLTVFPPDTVPFGFLLIAFAIVTMTAGNFLALRQRDLKRLLAYSSIAYTGYILLGFGIGFQYGYKIAFEGALFLILAHAFMKGGAFLGAGSIIYRVRERMGERGARDLDEIRGIGYRMPYTRFPLSISALALAGVPPLAGFWGKLFVVIGGLKVVGALGLFLALAVILNSFLSLGYYLPLIRSLFAEPKDERKLEGVKRTPFAIMAPTLITTFIIIALGVYPPLGMGIVHPAAELLSGMWV